MAAKIIVTALVKRYGDRVALDDVSFEVAAGEIFGLLGPNGAGKTTLLECISGLRKPDSGSIEVAGVDALARPDVARRKLGAALQDTALQDRITPREALRLFGAFYPVAVPPGELIDRFLLTEKADAPYESLSVGQKQRLALALAFVQAPDILLLDEPTAGLDPHSRRELHREIRQLRAEGRTVLLSTHALDEAQMLCDRILVLDAGRIVALGRPADLVAKSVVRPAIVLRTATPVPGEAWRGLEGIDAVETVGDGVRLEVANVGRALVVVTRWLEEQGIEMVDLKIERPSLEDVFVDLVRPQSRS